MQCCKEVAERSVLEVETARNLGGRLEKGHRWLYMCHQTSLGMIFMVGQRVLKDTNMVRVSCYAARGVVPLLRLEKLWFQVSGKIR